jgi:hypothetical protein
MKVSFVSTCVDSHTDEITFSTDVNGAYMKIKDTSCPLGQGLSHQDMLVFLKQCVAVIEFQISQSNETKE